MGSTYFSRREEAELERLLLKVKAANGFYPTTETFQVAQGTAAFVACELVFDRHWSKRKKQILLTVYEGAATKSIGKWHIPGGFLKPNYATVELAANAIARRELGQGVCIVELKLLDAHWWTREEHDYGRPYSAFYRATTDKPLRQGKQRRFFTREQILALPPEAMDEPHRQFALRYLA